MNEIKELVVENLKKSYRKGFLLKRNQVLKGITFFANKGEILSILGPNGAGKTTTFKIIVGISKPDDGKVLLEGESITLKNKHKIGFLPEHPYFYDYLTGEEYLDFVAHLMGIKNRKEKIKSVLKTVEMEKYSDIQLKKYSKGMLQRIGIAQAIINDPKLLILDEPLSGLDPIGRRKIKNLILSMKEKGKTIIFSSHILQDAEAVSDRVAIINRGEIVKTGTIEELLEAQEGEVEVSFSGLNELPEGFKYKRVERKNSYFYVYFEGEKDVNEFVKKILDNGARIKHIIPSRKTLEEIFEELK